MLDINNCIVIDYNYDIILELNQFRSSNKYLDEFLYNEDLVINGMRHGRTKVVYEKESKDIIGYYTICASAISLNREYIDNSEYYSNVNHDLLIRYAGAIGISCFAINQQYRNQYASDGTEDVKVSVFVLDEAFKDINDAADILSTKYVILSSTKEGRTLYKDYGFEFLDYEHKEQYFMYKYNKPIEITEEERKRKDKYVFNINSEDLGCYPMMMNL